MVDWLPQLPSSSLSCSGLHIVCAFQVGLCAPESLCLSGSSAGGWLAASGALQSPQLFRALVLTVPCLDPLGLMLNKRQGRIELGDAVDDPQVWCSTVCRRLFKAAELTVPCLDPLGLMLSQQQGRIGVGDAVNNHRYVSIRMKTASCWHSWFAVSSHQFL